MKRFIQFIVKNSTEMFGYRLVELTQQYEGIVTPWALVSENSTVVVFGDENYNEVINEKRLKQEIKCYNEMKIIKIIFASHESNFNEIDNKVCSLNMRNYILVDNKVTKIFSYQGEDSNILKLINYYIDYTTQEKGRESVKQNANNIMTYSIIAINVFIYIITAMLSKNIMESNINVLVLLGAKVNFLIQEGEYYRLFTCAFLHGGIVHLGLNMYMLYILGPLVEKVYGKMKYIIIYLVSAITSSLLSYLFSDSISIGASGAIFGLLGAALVFAMKMRKKIGKDFIKNIVSVIVVNLVIGILAKNIDNFGHVGGLLGGFFISTLLWKKVKNN